MYHRPTGLGRFVFGHRPAQLYPLVFRRLPVFLGLEVVYVGVVYVGVRVIMAEVGLLKLFSAIPTIAGKAV